MSARTGCPHRRLTGDRCTGQILVTGYCDTCGRSRTARPIPPDLEDGPDSGGPGAAEPFTLPFVELSDPVHEVTSRLPDGLRRCGKCRELIAPPLVQEPVPDKGYCPSCSEEFSFVPPLRPGELLNGQYKVLGILAHGGQGWVYLAQDTHLDHKYVAIKGLLNRHDKRLARLAQEERRYLIALNHPGIVGILDYVRHQPAGAPHEPPTHFIVMEYAGSSTLHNVVTRTRQGELPLGTPLDIEHVITYGCLILDALGHLHDKRLCYVDMKPSNVMHFEDQIKVIDLGGVRPLNGPETDLVITEHYAAPEVRETGPTVAHDLHTVGRTLEELALYAVSDVPGFGIFSFRRVLERATHPRAELRFSSAREMAGQLRGALREIRALRGSRDRPEPSRYFLPSPALLGHELGSVPPIEHWSRRPAPARTAPPVPQPLDPAVPSAAAVALGLPVPLPHPDDPRAAIFGLASYSPDQVLKQLPDQSSAEVAFHNLRRWLGIAGQLADAEKELNNALELLGKSAGQLCWRVAWHRGLLALARSDLARKAGERRRELAQLNCARRQFVHVMRAMPGEYAPKLAAGYCTERLPGTVAAAQFSAEELYEAVWLRNRAHGSAAFGLTRLALARGARAAALCVLDQVPEEARDHPASRVAALRVQAARLSAGEQPLPTLDDLRSVQERLAEAFRDRRPYPDLVPAGEAQLRLRAELLEWAIDMLHAAESDGTLTEGACGEGPHYTDLLGSPPAWPAREVPGQPTNESGPPDRAPPHAWPRLRAVADALRDLVLTEPRHTPVRAARFRLAECYRDLAWRSTRPADHERLADWANSVRPTTLT